MEKYGPSSSQPVNPPNEENTSSPDPKLDKIFNLAQKNLSNASPSNSKAALPEINVIKNKYSKLETEYLDTNTSPERKTEIEPQLVVVGNELNRLIIGLTEQSEKLEKLEKQWYKLYIDREMWCHKTEEELGTRPELLYDEPRIGVYPAKDSAARHASGYCKGEPGYSQAMTQAFKHVLKTIGEPLTYEYFDHLHATCVTNVDGLQKDAAKTSVHQSYGLDLSKVTDNAKKEWKSKKLLLQWEDYLEQIDKLSRDECKKFLESYLCALFLGNRTTRCHNTDTFPSKVNQLFATYYEEISAADSNPDDKLKAIVNLCRALEMLHIYPDGNQRAIAFALLTKLLLENNFCPAVLKDPCMFDGYFSTNEMVDLVKEGMEFYTNMT